MNAPFEVLTKSVKLDENASKAYPNRIEDGGLKAPPTSVPEISEESVTVPDA